MGFIELIEKAFTSPFGSFGCAFAIVAGAFYLVHWVTKKVTEIQSSHSTINESANKMDTYIDTLRKDIAYIKGSLELLQDKGNDLAQAHSPISLTDKGKELADNIHADAMIESNWENIRSQIDKSVTDKNAYDIQQYCIETMAVDPDALLSKDDVLLLKQYAYRTGRSVQSISIVPALKIRDRYFAERNIAIGDIDKYDPNKQNETK